MSANPPAGAQSISELKARVEAERTGLPFLVYRDGDGGQAVFSFDPSLVQASVGRLAESDLVLDWDDQVSRLHARFELAGGEWSVVDDGLSRNGTYLNGKLLQGRQLLSDGDGLRFGATEMTFRAPSGPGAGVAVVGQAPAAEELSSTQLRVLLGLCKRYQRGGEIAGPEGSEQLGEDLFLSPGEVRTHLGVLYAKFGLERLPQEHRPFRLVELAIEANLITERDL